MGYQNQKPSELVGKVPCGRFPKPNPAMLIEHLDNMDNRCTRTRAMKGIGSPKYQNRGSRRLTKRERYIAGLIHCQPLTNDAKQMADKVVAEITMGKLTRSMSEPGVYQNVNERGFPKPDPSMTKKNLSSIYPNTVVGNCRANRPINGRNKFAHFDFSHSIKGKGQGQKRITLGRSRANTAAARLPKPMIPMGRTRANTAAARLPQPRIQPKPETDPLLISYSKGSVQKPEMAARFRLRSLSG